MRTYSNESAPSTTPEPAKPDPIPDSSSNDNAGTSDIDVIDEDDEVYDAAYIEGDNVYYSTGQVAQQLNISRDMARKHIQDFEEFLHVSYLRTGKYRHLRILSTDIELLEKIVRLRKNRHSVETVKQILRDPYLAESLQAPTADMGELFAEILSRSNTVLLAEVKKLIDSGVEQNRLLLESNSEKDNVIDGLNREVDELKQLVIQQNSALQQQSEVLASVKERLDAQADAPKKKGLFGIFK